MPGTTWVPQFERSHAEGPDDSARSPNSLHDLQQLDGAPSPPVPAASDRVKHRPRTGIHGNGAFFVDLPRFLRIPAELPA